MTHDAATPPLVSSVVIATKDREPALRGCLDSLARQTRLPDEVIVIDASADNTTYTLVHEASNYPFLLRYARATVAHPGIQRNQGAAMAVGDVLIFADDDIVAEPGFVAALLAVLELDTVGAIGGVGGTIVNQTYVSPSRLNRVVLTILGGWPPGRSYAGRVIGPAINFLPADMPGTVTDVDWLNTTGTAYRRDVFLRHRFDPDVHYPFDDLHLSTNIGRRYRLVHAGNARYLHLDQGGLRQRDWVRFGATSLLGRHAVMHDNLERTGLLDYWRLVLHEVIYGPLAMYLRQGDARFDHAGSLLRGRLIGLGRLVRDEPDARRWVWRSLLILITVVNALRISRRRGARQAHPLGIRDAGS